MYAMHRGYGRAGGSYRSIDVASRIEGASPHGLVQILFDELQRALETLAALGPDGDPARRNERHARAVSILHGLESSLDMEKGGEIAHSLDLIYRESRRLLGLVQRNGDMAALAQTRSMVSDISVAWNAIG